MYSAIKLSVVRHRTGTEGCNGPVESCRRQRFYRTTYHAGICNWSTFLFSLNIVSGDKKLDRVNGIVIVTGRTYVIHRQKVLLQSYSNNKCNLIPYQSASGKKLNHLL